MRVRARCTKIKASQKTVDRVRTMRKLAVLSAAVALLGFGLPAHAQLWTWSFSDMGVDYSLSFDSLAGNVGDFTLTLNTSGYNHTADPAYLDSVDIKAWGGTDISFALLSAPGGTAWNPTEGSISSGPVFNTGCGGSLDASGFACVEAITKGVLNVDDGPYTFRFAVTADNFYTTSSGGTHVGAGYASATGQGSGYGITSMTSPVPEPEIYAMLVAGLGFLSFAARRRKTMIAAS